MVDRDLPQMRDVPPVDFDEQFMPQQEPGMGMGDMPSEMGGQQPMMDPSMMGMPSQQDPMMGG